MKCLGCSLLALVAIGAGLCGWAYSGRYDVGADEPHWAITSAVLEMVRERSIEVRAAGVEVPDLDDPQLVSLGAGHYAEMCAGCHRAPGVAESGIRTGLNPQPPDLTRAAVSPAEAYWAIKHGIRMSGMPAWGRTHDDREAWAIVAFLQKLPDLDANSYAALARGARQHDASDSVHEQGAGATRQESGHQH